ncbi:hypothetical protein ACFFX1_52750 [Dactylosporangium sucinum]|uniref:Vegetative cell wall protein gp1 n=1 Tax=Dactylosporangium sucinum TaxID=1424081 RepID=A0A917UBH8_9ACTN|nr:hypothetical protein [Dactylosporangium sucinum]GGM76379.1 hypothetical protein GCM10007977_092360 [Dactylosporangium sucinum]
MTDDEDGGRPDRWRQALGPLGAVWVAAAAVAGAPGHDPRRLGLAPDVTAGVALALAWVAVGLLVPLLATGVSAVWLGRWPMGAGPLTGWRSRRWLRAHELAERLAEERAPVEDQARARRRRAAIALAPPRRPTWMGDRWAAVEQRVGAAYGLDLVTVWPRLWLVLPEPERAEVRAAKAGWERSTRLAAWAVPFAALGLAWWPLLGIAVVLALAGWARGRSAVAYRADLLEAAFDLHAAALPDRLTGLDPDAGRRLTANLRKGV